MGRPSATEEQREEVRRRIRAAAAEAYRQGGVGAISARGVAQKAGVSVGVIYAHFGDLTGLMQSLWTGHVERQDEVFRSIAQCQPDPVRRLRALLFAYLEFGLENASLYRNAFMFVRPETQDLPAPASLKTFVFANLLIAALREGQVAGVIARGDPARLAQLLWSGVHGCLALPTNMDRVGFAPPRAMARPMVEMLVRGVRAEQEL